MINTITRAAIGCLRLVALWVLYSQFLQPIGFPNIGIAELFGWRIFYRLWTIDASAIKKQLKELEEDENIAAQVDLYFFIKVAILFFFVYLLINK